MCHSPMTVNALNQKAPNFRQHALPQVILCPVPSFQIALSSCEDLLIITCGNISNDVWLSQPVLGPGHGPLLRGARGGSGDQAHPPRQRDQPQDVEMMQKPGEEKKIPIK